MYRDNAKSFCENCNRKSGVLIGTMEGVYISIDSKKTKVPNPIKSPVMLCMSCYKIKYPPRLMPIKKKRNWLVKLWKKFIK